MTARVPVLMAVATSVAAAGALSLRSSPSENVLAVNSREPSAEVAQRTSVTSLGRIEPVSRIIDLTGPSGSRIGQLLVQNGQRVAKADVVAYLDNHDLKKAAKAYAEVQLAEAEKLLSVEKLHTVAQIEETQEKACEVQELTRVDIESQKAVIRRIERESENSERDVERTKKLLVSNTSTLQTLQDAQTRAFSWHEQLEEARLKLQRLERYLRLAEVIDQATLDAVRAESLKAEYATRTLSAKAQIAVCEAELEQTIVRAPIDGTVLKVLAYPGERVSDEPILLMGDLRQMYAVAEVYETDVRFVRLGQHASISSPALEKPMTGVVDEIALLIDKNDVLDIDPAAPIDARVVEVRIRLDESEQAARFVKLQVTVKIDLTSQPEAQR